MLTDTSLTDARHCQLDDRYRCTKCGRQFKQGRIVAMCPQGTKPPPPKPVPPRKKRTPQQVEVIKLNFCGHCKAFAHGLCLELVREGCGSCKVAADFDRKLAAGIGCKRGYFPETEREEKAAEKVGEEMSGKQEVKS